MANIMVAPSSDFQDNTGGHGESFGMNLEELYHTVSEPVYDTKGRNTVSSDVYDNIVCNTISSDVYDNLRHHTVSSDVYDNIGRNTVNDDVYDNIGRNTEDDPYDEHPGLNEDVDPYLDYPDSFFESEPVSPVDTTVNNIVCERMELKLRSWADAMGDIPDIDWYWKNWLPAASLSMLVGEPGKGKSSFVLYLTKSFILGEPFPDGTPYLHERGKVAWFETEANIRANIDRAQRWGGDALLEGLVFPFDDPYTTVSLNNDSHLERIAEIANMPDIRFMAIDSLKGAHSGSENDSESATVLKKLADIAQRSGVSILVTHHLRKASREERNEDITVDRLRGSSAFAQFPRTIMALDVPNPADDHLKRAYIIKSNYCSEKPSVGMCFGTEGITFSDAAPQKIQKSSVGDVAVAFLKEILSKGPLAQKVIDQAARDQGISTYALYEAKKLLHVYSHKNGRSKWVWQLPKVDVSSILSSCSSISSETSISSEYSISSEDPYGIAEVHRNSSQLTFPSTSSNGSISSMSSDYMTEDVEDVEDVHMDGYPIEPINGVNYHKWEDLF
jgi:hypothetical protein